MANVKLSAIAAAPSSFAAGDTVVGVRGGATDLQLSFAQIQAGLALISGGVAHGVAITNAATTIASNVVLPANNFLVGVAAADPVANTPTQVTALLNLFSTAT